MACEIIIPRLGWSMEEGTFTGWLKKDGDTIQRGDPLFELEGEKATQEIEAVDEGILRIPASGPRPGSVVQVGTVIGYLVSEGESLPADETPVASAIDSGTQPLAKVSLSMSASSENAGTAGTVETALPSAAGPAVRRMAREAGVVLEQVEGTGRGGRILPEDVQRASSSGAGSGRRPTKPVASPRARRIATELGIDWTRLAGTGARGRVREQDVRVAHAAGKSPISPGLAGDGQRLPLTSRRRVIAQRLVASRQQTVPVTLTTKVDATNLVNLRDQFKAVVGSSPIPGYQDIVMKLVADALRRHPRLGGRWHDEGIALPAEDELHLGMAVDTDDGLLVPVLRNVAQLSLIELADMSRQLAEQARNGTLAAADMQGGVFTITNLGAFGIDAFTPIINVPETAILGLGAIRREPAVLEDGTIGARQQITLSLTFDHRILDGVPAARFLQDIANAIANPSAALLS